jgi:hypothetical protein
MMMMMMMMNYGVGRTWEDQRIAHYELLSRNSLEDCGNIYVQPE